MSDWQPIKTAPLDGTWIRARETGYPHRDRLASAYRLSPQHFLCWNHTDLNGVGGGILLPFHPDEWQPKE